MACRLERLRVAIGRMTKQPAGRVQGSPQLQGSLQTSIYTHTQPHTHPPHNQHHPPTHAHPHTPTHAALVCAAATDACGGAAPWLAQRDGWFVRLSNRSPKDVLTASCRNAEDVLTALSALTAGVCLTTSAAACRPIFASDWPFGLTGRIATCSGRPSPKGDNAEIVGCFCCCRCACCSCLPLPLLIRAAERCWCLLTSRAQPHDRSHVRPLLPRPGRTPLSPPPRKRCAQPATGTASALASSSCSPSFPVLLVPPPRSHLHRPAHLP